MTLDKRDSSAMMPYFSLSKDLVEATESRKESFSFSSDTFEAISSLYVCLCSRWLSNSSRNFLSFLAFLMIV